MSTTEDVLLRFAIAQDNAYDLEVISESDGEALLESVDQPQVRVSARPDQPWCTCDEDAVPGTCTHVLYLASQDHEISETIRDNLQTDLDLAAREITELTHELTARKQERKALSEAMRLLESKSLSSDKHES